MLTRVGITFVGLFFTSGTLIPRWTVADKSGYFILTGAAVLTGTMTAFINVGLASFSVPAVGTTTNIIVYNIRAFATVLTWPIQTLIYILLAKAASVASLTLAAESVNLVLALAVIEAGVG